jgi:hypothetical protein
MAKTSVSAKPGAISKAPAAKVETPAKLPKKAVAPAPKQKSKPAKTVKKAVKAGSKTKSKAKKR